MAGRSDLAAEERDRVGGALKVLANAASYGIYAEMHRQESETPSLVQSAPPEPDGRDFLVDALKKQLGLNLTSGRGSIQDLVVDRLELVAN